MATETLVPEPRVGNGSTSKASKAHKGSKVPGTGRDSTEATPRMTSRQRMILFVLLGAQFMLAVDFSILNVALPAIGTGLGFGLDNLQWVATAFALPAAGFTLFFGRIADLAGRRRIFMFGMALLVVGSVIGGLATSPNMLLVGRVAQGLATAIATPAGLSLLTTSFAEGRMRERALGLNGALLSGGFTAGALLGGLLTGLVSWRAAFLINIPVAALILAITPILLKESRQPDRVKLDIPGAITVTGGLLALVFGVVTGGEQGWTNPIALLSFAIAITLLVSFWFVELRSPNPLASVRILTRKSVKWGNFGGLLVFGMESAMVFVLTLYLQEVLHYSAVVTGLVFGLPGIVAVIAGIIAPRFIGRAGAHKVLFGGLIVQGLSNLALLFIGDNRAYIALVLAGLAIGFFGHIYALVAFTVTATSGLPNSEQGLATGLSTMTQQVGIVLGTPILSAIVVSQGANVLGGIHLAIAFDVVVTLVGATLIGIFLVRGSRRRAAVETA